MKPGDVVRLFPIPPPSLHCLRMFSHPLKGVEGVQDDRRAHEALEQMVLEEPLLIGWIVFFRTLKDEPCILDSL